jgi:hypothetical protein
MRPHIVCLPGFLGDVRVFEPFRRLAHDRYEVHLMGLDEAPPPVHAHYLTGSFGGLVAAGLPPQRIRSLAMVGTLPDARLIPRAVRVQSRVLRRLPSPLLEPLYLHHSRRSLAADGVELDSRGLDAETLRRRLRFVLEHAFVFPDVPTLFLMGATDAQAPTSGQVLHHQPRAEVGHVPGGHRPYASHPGPLLTELERWWRSLG